MKILVLVTTVFLSLLASHSFSATIDKTNPFFSLIGKISRDEIKKVYILHEPQGGLWQIGDDGKTQAGTWRTDGEARVCYTVSGIPEGCFDVRENKGGLSFHNKVNGAKFRLIKSIYTKPILSPNQRKFYVQATRAGGAVEVERGGNEIVYWHSDGLIHVVQPEGWLKVGSWWFDSKENLCDNINGHDECFPIAKVEKNNIFLDYVDDGELIRLKVRLQYFDH